MIVDTENDEECNEVEDDDMGVKKGSRDVTDGKHAEDVPLLGFDILQIVDNVDGDEDTAGESGDAREDGTHEA